MIPSLICMFFFFKQKTAYEMRISDWSSDVCSSDLADHGGADAGVAAGRLDHRLTGAQRSAALGVLDDAEGEAVLHRAHRVEGLELGVEVDALRRQLADRSEERPGGQERVRTTRNWGSPNNYQKKHNKSTQEP